MEISKRSVVRIHPAPALFVDEKSLNNEASVHAYNPKGREKEGHNHRGGARDFDLLSGKDCGSTPHTSTNFNPWLNHTICQTIIMKHSESGNRKVLKQLKKCPDIEEIRATASGHMILAKNGQQYLAHFSAKAFHPLRRWLKKNTRIQNLKF